MQIDFVDLHSYTGYYFRALLIIFLIVFFELRRGEFKGYRIGVIIMILIIIYMGWRPVSGRYFADMGVYARYYRNYAEGMAIYSSNDFFFHGFMKACSYIMNVNNFFLLCATLYTLPLYWASKKWFKEYWFYAFLLLVGSFSFWAYGTNGIRNGLATSFFVLAMSRDNWGPRITLMILSIGFHGSMLLPAFAYALTYLNNKSKYYLYFWLATIPLSLAAPEFWKGLFATLVEDDRVDYLTLDEAKEYQFEKTGFRWDFLLYSASGVLTGWYYIFRKNFNDKFYYRLYNIYLFANGFWILVITALYSNRFAYLSWFLLAIVICYPWMKGHFVKLHARKFALVFLAYYLFTFFMNVIIYGK